MVTETYRLPIHWICPLLNGDYSGLSADEEKEIHDFLEDVEGYAIGVNLDSEDFYPSNDANSIAGICMDVIFRIND